MTQKEFFKLVTSTFYIKYNKEGDEDGPWKTEPNSEEFVYRDHRCFIARDDLGDLECYFMITDREKKILARWYKADLNVYGGLTFDKRIIGLGNALGFSLFHRDMWIGRTKATYKNIEFARNSLKHAIDQVMERCSK